MLRMSMTLNEMSMSMMEAHSKIIPLVDNEMPETFVETYRVTVKNE